VKRVFLVLWIGFFLISGLDGMAYSACGKSTFSDENGRTILLTGQNRGLTDRIDFGLRAGRHRYDASFTVQEMGYGLFGPELLFNGVLTPDLRRFEGLVEETGEGPTTQVAFLPGGPPDLGNPKPSAGFEWGREIGVEKKWLVGLDLGLTRQSLTKPGMQPDIPRGSVRRFESSVSDENKGLLDRLRNAKPFFSFALTYRF
jgi:hypothetical protein